MELFTEIDKTYASRANAIKAIEKKNLKDLRYVIAVNKQGRFFPVFLGNDPDSIGVIFHGFCVSG